jgi:tetratricopeptide (TPR) repeat protein
MPQPVPEAARAAYQQANGLKDRGAWHEALAAYDRALQLHPDYAHALCNRGAVLSALQRYDEALASYDRALLLEPGDDLAHYNRGLVLQQRQDLQGALAAYDRAIALNPGSLLAHFHRGVVLQKLGLPEAALGAYARTLELRPALAPALFNQGNVLKDLGRTAEALASYDAAIAADANHAEAHSHRGALLQQLGRRDEALAAYQRALAIRPDYAEAYFNRGTLLRDQLRWREALADYDRSLALKPVFADALYNKALVLLMLGDFGAGWPLWEWRWENAARLGLGEPRRFRQPQWRGQEPVAGRRVLLWCEQGLGDTLQFCRYAQLVAARGAQVILEVQAPLTTLLATLPGVQRIVAHGSALPDFDLQCSLMSLPLAFGTTLQSVPAPIPYLRADAVRVAAWQAQLAAAPGAGARTPRVGLVFSGSTVHGNDHNRSLALATWIPHLPRGIQYVCLQKEIRAPDRAALAAAPWIGCPAAQLGDFADTAALVEALDLVVSVDTSVAHLAGALGKATWLLLPHNPDWRWMLDRADTPWYPSLRLFRQGAPGDWHGVLSRVGAELRRLPGSGEPRSHPP